MTTRITHLLPIVSFVLWTCVAWAGEPTTGSASQGQTPQGEATSEQTGTLTTAQVEARTTAYLEAFRLNDLQTAYRMHGGALDGSLTPLVFMQQAGSGGIRVLSYKITKVTIRGPGRAFVEAAVSYEVPQFRKPYTAPMKIEWVLRDGQLYRDLGMTGPGFTGHAVKDLPD